MSFPIPFISSLIDYIQTGNASLFTIFSYLLCICLTILIVFSIVSFLISSSFSRSNKASSSNNKNNIPYGQIIHEFKLKLDMAKMNYNALLIRLGLHKISKRLLFTKKDYYFMNIDKEMENNEKIKRELGINDINTSKLNNNNNNSFSYYSDDNTYANTVDGNYSRLDEEEPLK